MSNEQHPSLPPEAISYLSDALVKITENRSYKNTGFVAGEDIMDELRAQYSAVTPHIERQLPNLAIGILDSLEEGWGNFIPEDTLDFSPGIVDRILCVGRDDYSKLKRLWMNPSLEEIDDVSERSEAVFKARDGRMVIIQQPPEFSLPETLSSEEEAILQRFGGLEKARATVKMTYFVNALSHEIIHEYEDGANPFSFSESGSEYYASHISESFGVNYGSMMGYGEKPRIFYGELVEKYGDDVHRLFFGLLSNTQREDPILGEFNNEKNRELFPNHFT
jgi:hypothetical protein